MRKLAILLSIIMTFGINNAFAASSEKVALKSLKKEILEIRKSLPKNEGNNLLQEFNRFKDFENENDFEISDHDQALFMFSAQISPANQEILADAYCDGSGSNTFCLENFQLTSEELGFQVAGEIAYGFKNSESYSITTLIDLIDNLTAQAKAKIDMIKSRGENISIADMFDMQMNMNHLAQMSEMSTSIVNATNTAIMSMARNIKG